MINSALIPIITYDATPSGAPVAPTAGFVSLLALWLGGAMAPTGPPPPVVVEPIAVERTYRVPLEVRSSIIGEEERSANVLPDSRTAMVGEEERSATVAPDSRTLRVS
jgi:hypothetical protein